MAYGLPIQGKSMHQPQCSQRTQSSRACHSETSAHARFILKRALLTACVLFATCSTSFAQSAFTFSGKVVSIADGDTISVLHDGVPERVRLYGIDCPEKRQAFGTRAREFTGDLAFGKEAKIVVHDIDRYGRTVGEVILADGTNLNHELVRAGLAWWYEKYGRGRMGAAEAGD